MIFTGTASELAELTRKWWGSEWWPERITPQIMELVGVPYGVHLDEAASIIFAAAMVKMIEKGVAPLLGKPGPYNCSIMSFMGGYGRVNYFGPSPLHAVLAALEVVG